MAMTRPEAGSSPERRGSTAAGHCFRYESRNIRGLERLWDFTMREIIYCGA